MPATPDTARVVVTGMGAITPLGNDVATLWRNLLAGTSVARHIDRFDLTGFRTRFAAEVVDFDPTDYMDPKEARRADRAIQFAMATSTQALDQAGLRPRDEEEAEQIGVLIGTGIGGLSSMDEAARVMREEGPDRVTPLTAVNMLPDMSSGQVAIQFGLTGVNFCVISACATGTNAVGEAAEIIKRGDALAMVVGGTEAPVTPLALAAFHRTGSLSTRNDDPAHASRPFDKDRDGFVVGEGAGGLVLERLDFALERGAAPLAEVVGYGNSADAFHVSAPEPEGRGAARSMTRAMAKAGIGPEDIDYINAHGTSTPLNDRSETFAIKRALGDRAYQVPVSSTKSMTGHMLGAAGVVEAVVCVQAIREGVIPPTINYETPDPECDLDYVPNVARTVPVRTAMSNSFGFGGHNATVILRAYS
jgi:3-oxoacyl-[acyl-carrier-protein] synthase II